MDIQTIARLNLKKFRNLKKLSQDDMANRLNINLKTYQRLESGETKIDLPRLGDLSKALELPSEFDLLESDTLYLHQEIHKNTNIFNKDAILRDDSEDILTLKDKIIEEKDRIIEKQEEDISFLRGLLKDFGSQLPKNDK